MSSCIVSGHASELHVIVMQVHHSNSKTNVQQSDDVNSGFLFSIYAVLDCMVLLLLNARASHRM
jgi:hypothetical protein